WPAILARPSRRFTTRCHSVFSRRSPVALSRQVSEVATRKFAIGRPSCVRRISGSAPRLPIKITLLTLPAMMSLLPPHMGCGFHSCHPSARKWPAANLAGLLSKGLFGSAGGLWFIFQMFAFCSSIEKPTRQEGGRGFSHAVLVFRAGAGLTRNRRRAHYL